MDAAYLVRAASIDTRICKKTAAQKLDGVSKTCVGRAVARHLLALSGMDSKRAAQADR